MWTSERRGGEGGIASFDSRLADSLRRDKSDNSTVSGIWETGGSEEGAEGQGGPSFGQAKEFSFVLLCLMKLMRHRS